jgi:hypothetical protein
LEVGIKESIEKVKSSMIYLMYCKNFCKCHDVPSLSTIKKKKEKGSGMAQVVRVPVNSAFFLTV